MRKRRTCRIPLNWQSNKSKKIERCINSWWQQSMKRDLLKELMSPLTIEMIRVLLIQVGMDLVKTIQRLLEIKIQVKNNILNKRCLSLRNSWNSSKKPIEYWVKQWVNKRQEIMIFSKNFRNTKRIPNVSNTVCQANASFVILSIQQRYFWTMSKHAQKTSITLAVHTSSKFDLILR